MDVHNVYVASNRRGDVIYVGLTLSAKTRIYAHAKHSNWFSECDSMRILRFETRGEAHEFEKKLIKKLNPKFNIAGVKPHVVFRGCNQTRKIVKYHLFLSHFARLYPRNPLLAEARAHWRFDCKSRPLFDRAISELNFPLARRQYSESTKWEYLT